MPDTYTYGAHPEPIKAFEPEWHEYMHYLYLPVVMPGEKGIRLPPNLEFLRQLVEFVAAVEMVDTTTSGWGRELYVYVTARRGFASPGNPLNRPGWHADGFGTDDINYIWSDRWPTRFAAGTFTEISTDHVISAKQFEHQIGVAGLLSDTTSIRVYDGEPNMVYRLDPSVIHATPIIPDPGGDRSFFKISVSTDRYNLLGNSRNHLFDYDWKMWSRSEVRNDPAWAGGDSGPQEGAA